MEDMKLPAYSSSHPSSNAPSPKLAVHKNPQVISKSKFKPKIRIIQLFAPEIINTDVANFRELVQRLTGNKRAERRKKTKKLPSRDSPDHANKAMQLHGGLCSSILRREKIKEEENYENETWADTNSSSSFIDGFTENLDAFIQELIK